MTLACIILLTLNFLFRGFSSLDSIIGVEKCTPIDWVIFSTFILLSFTIMVLVARHSLKTEPKTYTKLSILKFQSLCFVLGILPSFIGAAPGSIIIIVLLHIGLDPISSTTTSMYLIMITVTAACIPFLISGGIRIDYGVTVFVLTLIGTYIGMKL